MKVVIFCGGLGLRMGETSARIPKPMIPIGDKPILWHIMNYYASFGVTDFVLCLGYKAEVVKEYFLSYNEALANDFVLSATAASASSCSSATSTTGRSRSSTPGCTPSIGQRLKKVQSYLDDDEIFLATYGDGLTDAPLPEMIETLTASDNVGLFLASRPTYNFHVVTFDEAHQATSDAGRDDARSLDQRRLLRLPAGDLRLHRRGRGSRRGAVPAPDRGGQAGSLSRTTASGRRWTRSRTSTGSRACYESGQAPWRTPVGAPNGTARAARRRRSRCTRCRSTPIDGSTRSSSSAPTPTTSRSAAAARSFGSRPRIPTPRWSGSCSARDGTRADEARRSADGLPRRGSRTRASSSRTSATRFLPYVGGTVKELFEELKADRVASARLHAPALRPAPGPPARSAS